MLANRYSPWYSTIPLMRPSTSFHWSRRVMFPAENLRRMLSPYATQNSHEELSGKQSPR